MYTAVCLNAGQYDLSGHLLVDHYRVYVKGYQNKLKFYRIGTPPPLSKIPGPAADCMMHMVHPSITSSNV